MGAITQSSEAFYNVRSDFSIIVNYYEDIRWSKATAHASINLVDVMSEDAILLIARFSFAFRLKLISDLQSVFCGSRSTAHIYQQDQRGRVATQQRPAARSC
jgi:hypothetical protein